MHEQHPLDPEELAEKFANKDAGKLADLKTVLNYKQMQPLNTYRSQKFEEEELTNRSRVDLQLTQRSGKDTIGKRSQPQNDFLKNNSTAQIRDSIVEHNYSYSAGPNKLSSSQILNNFSNMQRPTDQEWHSPHQDTVTKPVYNPPAFDNSQTTKADSRDAFAGLSKAKSTPMTYANKLKDLENQPDAPKPTAPIHSLGTKNPLQRVEETPREASDFDKSEVHNDFDDDEDDNRVYQPSNSTMWNKGPSAQGGLAPQMSKISNIARIDEEDWGDLEF